MTESSSTEVRLPSGNGKMLTIEHLLLALKDPNVIERINKVKYGTLTFEITKGEVHDIGIKTKLIVRSDNHLLIEGVNQEPVRRNQNG
jgi:hypothetical protein